MGVLSVVKNCSKAELMPILQARIMEGRDVLFLQRGLGRKSPQTATSQGEFH